MNEKLLAYYFGTLDEQARLEIEEQLLKSPTILMEFIAIKRSFEVNGEVERAEKRQPSAAAATRLRREVEARFSTKEYWYWLPPAVAAALLVVSGGAFLYSKMAEKSLGHTVVESQVNCSVGSSNGSGNDLVVNQATAVKSMKSSLKKTPPTPMMAEAYGENSHPSKDSR